MASLAGVQQAPFNPLRVRGYSDKQLAAYAEKHAAAAAEIERRQRETPPALEPVPVKAQLKQTERTIRDLQSERQKLLRQGRRDERAEQLLETIRRLRARGRQLQQQLDSS